MYNTIIQQKIKDRDIFFLLRNNEYEILVAHVNWTITVGQKIVEKKLKVGIIKFIL